MDRVFRAVPMVPALVTFSLLLCPSITSGNAAVQAQGIQAVEPLLKEGDRNLQQGQLLKALAAYKQALPLQRNDRASKAQTLTKIAKIHSRLLEESQALDAALQALQIHETLSDPVGKAEALMEVGDAYLDLEHEQKALDILHRAHTLLQREKQPTERIHQELADTLNDLGRAHRNLEQYPQAIQFFQQSLALQQQLKNSFEVGRLHGSIGSLYILQGERTQAAPFMKRAHQTLTRVVADSQQSGNRALEAKAIYHMGINLLLEKQQGLEQLEQASELFRMLNYRVREADALSSLGLYHQIWGQFGQQLQYEQQAQAIFQTTGEPIYTNNSLVMIGSTLKRLGRHSEAVNAYEQVLANYHQLEQSPQRDRYPLQFKSSQVLTKLGAAQAKLGQYSQAIKTLEGRLRPYTTALQSESLPVSDQKEVVNLLQQLGEAHSKIDQYPQALAYLTQALKLSRPLQDPLAGMAVHYSLGNVYVHLGQRDKALKLYRQATQLYRQALGQTARQLGHHPSVLAQQFSDARSTGQQLLDVVQPTGNDDLTALALSTLGAEYAEQGKPTQALQTYQQALKLYRSTGNRPYESLMLTQIGLLHFDQKNETQALETFEQQLALSRLLGNRSDTARTLSLVGSIHYQQKRYAQAEQVLREAADLWDTLHPGLSDQDRISQRDSIISTFEALQQTLIAQNQPHAALEISERGRARAFVERLASRAAKVTERQQPVEALTIEQIQQVAQTQQATLVEYSIVSGQIFMWVVQPSGTVHFEQAKGLSAPLEQLVRESRIAIGARGQIAVVPTAKGRSEPPQKALQALYQLLIAPIAQYLPTDPRERIIFIPEGELFLVPFAAFQDPQGQALLQKHTVLTAPSIQALTLTRQQRQNLPAQEEALVVGNPKMPRLASQSELLPLPGAEKEAIAIAKVLKTQAVIGSEATKSKIVERMPKARLIHLATHGLLENIQGSDDVQKSEIPGAIALAPDSTEKATDGFLTASEIGDMALNADLVVLSACDTGRGRITGDGVVGLSRSFLAAGVPSVVVSLWKVPDESTAQLMTTFYQELQQGANKAQALRQAMLKTRQSYPNPRDWAAFTLIGEAE